MDEQMHDETSSLAWDRLPRQVGEDEPNGSDQLQRVRGNLHKVGTDLAAAEAAGDRNDWATVLQAVRMIQGRMVITRRLVEYMLELDVTDEPPLVRTVQAVRQLISGHEVDRLPPDELRARMHAVLQTLDRELKAFLLSPDEPPIPKR